MILSLMYVVSLLNPVNNESNEHLVRNHFPSLSFGVAAVDLSEIENDGRLGSVLWLASVHLFNFQLAISNNRSCE